MKLYVLNYFYLFLKFKKKNISMFAFLKKTILKNANETIKDRQERLKNDLQYIFHSFIKINYSFVKTSISLS